MLAVLTYSPQISIIDLYATYSIATTKIRSRRRSKYLRYIKGVGEEGKKIYYGKIIELLLPKRTLYRYKLCFAV